MKMLSERSNKVVALHGQLGMAEDWSGLAEDLASAGYELEAVDLWKYLKDGEVSMEEFGKQLNESHDGGQILLGYSMGGRLALHALIDDPLKWKGAVIISAHAGLALGHRGARRLTDDDWARKVECLPWSELLSLWNGQAVLGDDVMPERSALESKRLEIIRSFKCWSLAEQELLMEKIAHMSEVPILFVVGENDSKFSSLWDELDGVQANIKIFKVPNAGHRVPWEAEADLLDGVLSWMRTEL